MTRSAKQTKEKNEGERTLPVNSTAFIKIDHKKFKKKRRKKTRNYTKT